MRWLAYILCAFSRHSWFYSCIHLYAKAFNHPEIPPFVANKFHCLHSKGFQYDLIKNQKKQSADYMLGFIGMYIKFDDVHVKSEYRYNLSKLGDIWLVCSKIVVLDACRHLFCLVTARAYQFLNICNIFPKYTEEKYFLLVWTKTICLNKMLHWWYVMVSNILNGNHLY